MKRNQSAQLAKSQKFNLSPTSMLSPSTATGKTGYTSMAASTTNVGLSATSSRPFTATMLIKESTDQL